MALRVQVVEALTALAESAPDVPMGRAHHADTPRFVLSRAFDEPNVTYEGSLTPPTLGLALTLELRSIAHPANPGPGPNPGIDPDLSPSRSPDPASTDPSPHPDQAR